MNTSFLIAKRYLIAKKNAKTVNLIMWVSIVALTFATASMIIFLSVFSGLKALNIQYISNVNAELVISPKQGKLIKNLSQIENILKKEARVAAYSKTIEEKVYLSYQNKQEIANLKAVDMAFIKVTPIDTMVVFGSYPSFEYTNEMIMGSELANRMGVPVSDQDYATVYLPRPGTGIISNQEEAFKSKPVYLTGVFAINETYNSYIFAPIELAQELLNLPKNSAYHLELKLKDTQDIETFQKDLINKIGTSNLILNRQQQDASFLKMMNIEQLVLYLMFVLVIFIASFTLAGAIIIIILDKKTQTQSLLSLGMSVKSIQHIFFLTGLLMTMSSIFFGLLIGLFVTWGQLQFNWVMANPTTAYPVSIELNNVLAVALTVFLFGLIVSFLMSRRVRIG